MKTKLTTTTLLLSLLLASCNSNPKNAAEKSESKNETVVSENKTPRQNIIRKYIPLSSQFQHITSLGSVDIIYTQGPECQLELEGDSTTLQNFTMDIESQILSLSLSSERNRDINRYGNSNNVKAYVTCPSLRYVSLVGNGEFTSDGQWTSTDVQLGAMSNGSFHVKSIKCQTFLFNGSNNDNSEIGSVEADEVKLFTTTNSILTANVNTPMLILDASSNSSITVSGTAGKVNSNRTAKAKIINNLK